jgi:hypothetical protein
MRLLLLLALLAVGCSSGLAGQPAPDLWHTVYIGKDGKVAAHLERLQVPRR